MTVQQCPVKGKHISVLHRDACPACNPLTLTTVMIDRLRHCVMVGGVSCLTGDELWEALHAPLSMEETQKALANSVAEKLRDGSEALIPTPGDIPTHTLSPEARAGIHRFMHDAEPSDNAADYGWWDFDTFCGVWFRLKFEPDTVRVFPKGKWATLQVMEQLIEAAIKHPTTRNPI